jgi:hypothetical protein
LVSFDAEVSEVDRLIQEKIMPLLRKETDYSNPTEV